VTIVIQGRISLFGTVENETMRLNAAGQMVKRWWRELGPKFPDVTPDACAVMPNHFHGVILVGADLGVCPRPIPNVEGAHPGAPLRAGAGTSIPEDAHPGAPLRTGAGTSVPEVVHRFKTLTTKRYADGVKQLGWSPFPGRLWQRNYYEHIIRSGEALNRIRQYIIDNPARWEFDHENLATSPNSRPRQEFEPWRV